MLSSNATRYFPLSFPTFTFLPTFLYLLPPLSPPFHLSPFSLSSPLFTCAFYISFLLFSPALTFSPFHSPSSFFFSLFFPLQNSLYNSFVTYVTVDILPLGTIYFLMFNFRVRRGVKSLYPSQHTV